MKLSELLEAWRHHQHMSIEEASDLIGIEWGVYRRVEKGGPMRPATFMKIMDWMMSDR